MSKNALGIEVPAGSDSFDPQGDMVEMGASFAGRVVVPVANAADRDTLLAAVGATPDVPLLVWRNDTRQVEVSWGSGFFRATDSPRAVLKYGAPADKQIPATAGATLDLIAAGDPGGIPALTPAVGGLYYWTVSLQFAASTGSASAVNVVPVFDGAAEPTASGFLLHSGLGAGAQQLRAWTMTYPVWLTPGAPHTFNARVVFSGGGGMSFNYMSYQLRGQA